MSWQCKFISEEEASQENYRPEYGHMRFAPKTHGYDLSPEYKRDWEGKRPPIIVYIPMLCGDGKVRGRFICPDSKYWVIGKTSC